MDIKRDGVARQRQIRIVMLVFSLTAAVAFAGWRVSLLQPAAPSVERATVWVDTVKRGPMLREVRGLGSLVAEETVVVPASTEGRVDRVWLLPGASVRADTVLVTLSSPELQQQKLDAEFAVKMAEARLLDLKVRLDSETLAQRAELARMESEQQQARMTFARDELMFQEKLKVELDYRVSKAKADQLDGRVSIERERLNIRKESVQAQLAVQRAEIDKLVAMRELKQSQADALQVRAGVSGVLQELPVSAGQKLAAGTIIAKIAQPSHLKAQLKIAETQAKDIAVGQAAQIDTRNGIIAGRVMRIDPAAREGTVLVDVALIGPLPAGVRMDLSVDGTVEIERLKDVLYIGRPVFGQPNAQVGLFRLSADGKEAARVMVKLGRASVNTIEVVEGLKVGDPVILSDMSAQDATDRIQLN